MLAPQGNVVGPSTRYGSHFYKLREERALLTKHNLYIRPESELVPYTHFDNKKERKEEKKRKKREEKEKEKEKEDACRYNDARLQKKIKPLKKKKLDQSKKTTAFVPYVIYYTG